MIFFDLDDTLIDYKISEGIGIRALYNMYKNEIMDDEEAFKEQWDKAFKRHFNKYLKHEMTYDAQWIERMKDIFGHSGVELSDGEAEKRYKFYMNAYKQSWSLFDDTIPTLKELKGYGLGLITNGDLKLQSSKIEKMGLKDFFSTIVISDQAGIAKPDKKIFEIACKRADVSPNDCYFVGDDLEIDILAGVKAGMRSVWINRYGKKTEHNNFYTIKSLRELKNILENGH